MKITEKMLVEGFSGLTNGWSYISVIGKKEIIWNYRKIHDEGAAVSCPREADFISLERSRAGRIELAEERNLLDFAAINTAEEKAWGNLI